VEGGEELVVGLTLPVDKADQAVCLVIAIVALAPPQAEQILSGAALDPKPSH